MNEISAHEKCYNDFNICIRSLRVGEEGRYTTTFSVVIDCIQKWLAQQGGDPDQLFFARIEEAMQCQVRHDNCRLADILEYEIMPLMFGGESR